MHNQIVYVLITKYNFIIMIILQEFKYFKMLLKILLMLNIIYNSIANLFVHKKIIELFLKIIK